MTSTTEPNTKVDSALMEKASQHSAELVMVSDDEAFLSSLGYKQVFKRQFTKVELFGVGFSIIGVLPSIASVFVFALPNGGPTALVWGWAVCAFLLCFVGFAMSELGSAMPTSGGLYYWAFTLSSERYRRLFAWIVGYSNTIGLIAGFASVEWGCAVQINAAISIGSDMRFVPTTGKIYGIYVALLFGHAIICSLATRILARLQHLYILFNIVVVFAVIVALPIATPKEFKNTTSYSLTGFANLNGWPNGYAFVLSFLAPVWTIAAYDSCVHISEEATNARTAVPFAINSSVIIAGFLGWGINMALAFNMGTDVNAIMANPIGQPLATIFFNSFGKTGTLTIWSFIVILQFMMGSSSLLATSRQTFAFARDGGLPGSSVISRLNSVTSTPVNGVWCSSFCALLLGLLAFAGPQATNAIFALAVAGQNIAYSIPIVTRFVFSSTNGMGRGGPRMGPYDLGRFSLPVAVVAVSWMAFTTIIVLFPMTPNPDAAGMNYTVVVLGAVLSLAIGYYYFPVYGGIHWFKGPLGAIKRMEEEQGVASLPMHEKE